MDLNATILGQSISFILFVWFCMKFIWPKIINIIETRKKEIFMALSNAEKSRKDLELLKIESNNIINQSQEKAILILKQANYNKSIILEQAKLQAEQEKKKILLQANYEINMKKEQVKRELIQQISILAINIAEKIIKSSANKEKNFDLINQLTMKL